MNVSEIIGGVYDYLGRKVTQTQVSIGQILPILLDTINYYGVDLDITDENWLLNKFDYVPGAKDEPLSVPNFEDIVSVEVRDLNSTSEGDWQPIDVCNANDVQRIGRDGEKGAAIYGTPPNIVFSFDPNADWQIEARIWYKPKQAQPSSLSDSPKLNTCFHTMLKLRTALACIPYLELADPSALAASLTLQLTSWEKKWFIWVNRDRNAGPIQKRDFRGARRSHGWGGKDSWWWY
jgi:hypothetical protein